MSSRFLIASSLLSLLVTLGALAALGFNEQRRRYAAIGAFLLVSAGWKFYAIAWSSSYEVDYLRELVFSGLALWVALSTWRLERPRSLECRMGLEVAVMATALCGVAGYVAMKIPGPHPDYRGLVPLTVATAAVLILAGWFAGAREYRVEAVACWGLAWIFIAQTVHLLGFEVSLDAAAVGAVIHIVAYVWAIYELSLALGVLTFD